MDRLPMKRWRNVVPKQERVVVPKQVPRNLPATWDEHGGVFTQENPRFQKISKAAQKLEGENDPTGNFYLLMLSFI